MYIYKITNKINNKCYIGQTTKANPQKRWREHLQCARNNANYPLYHSMCLHGIENFVFEEIYFAFDIDELNRAEEFFIKDFHSMITENGYNCKEGGHNKTWSDYSKKKFSEKCKGRVITESARKKIGESSIKKWNDPEWVYDHKKSMEEVFNRPGQIERMSAASKKIWEENPHLKEQVSKRFKDVPKSKDQRDKMSEGMLRAHSKAFNVFVSVPEKKSGRGFSSYTKGKYVGTFSNPTVCAKVLGVKQPKISSCLKKNRPQHNGYIFEYVELEKEDFDYDLILNNSYFL
jgi:group I intron endonuclease